jgi:NACalpha-BTF3-like transcription factor
MPVDTSIYRNIRPFQMESPIESESKALALTEAKKRFTLDRDVSDVAKQTGGDPEAMSKALLARGHVAPAMQLQGAAAAQRKAKIDEELKMAEAIGSDAMMLDQAWRQALQESGGDRVTAMARIQPVYSNVRQKWARFGKGLPESFDPDQNFAGIGAAKEAIQYLKTLDTTTHMTELGRLMRERDALPQGDPRRAQYDKTIATYKAGRGTDVTVNTGPMAPGKAGETKVDEGLLDTSNRLMRLNQIESLYKPQFQEIGTKIMSKYTSLKAMAGIPITNKDRKDLTEISKYRRNALENLNEYIRSVTGAVVNANEVPRLMGAMPNPGQGLFDGDDPVTFEAKKDDIIKMLKMAEARLAYIKRNGMSLDDGRGNPVIPLERMPQLINDRGKEIESQLKAQQPKADEKALQRAVRRQLGIEFGLVSD